MMTSGAWGFSRRGLRRWVRRSSWERRDCSSLGARVMPGGGRGCWGGAAGAKKREARNKECIWMLHHIGHLLSKRVNCPVSRSIDAISLTLKIAACVGIGRSSLTLTARLEALRRSQGVFIVIGGPQDHEHSLVNCSEIRQYSHKPAARSLTCSRSTASMSAIASGGRKF